MKKIVIGLTILLTLVSCKARQPDYYMSCKEARHHVRVPLYRGDPGYSSRLDRDNDGVACDE